MGNVWRFIRYTFVREPRRSHRRGFWKRYGVDLLAGFGGGLFVSMPIWMILLGVI